MFRALGLVGILLGILVWSGVTAAGAEFPKPGKGPAPAAQVIYFRWDTYRTLLVVGDGVGTTRPAWVVTYENPPHQVFNALGIGTVIGLFGYELSQREPQQVVAYRAQAFADDAGVIHLDARKAVIAGPQAQAWSPDSFAVHPDASVTSEDDNGNGNAGQVELRILQTADPERYRAFLTEARIAAGGDI